MVDMGRVHAGSLGSESQTIINAEKSSSKLLLPIACAPVTNYTPLCNEQTVLKEKEKRIKKKHSARRIEHFPSDLPQVSQLLQIQRIEDDATTTEYATTPEIASVIVVGLSTSEYNPDLPQANPCSKANRSSQKQHLHSKQPQQLLQNFTRSLSNSKRHHTSGQTLDLSLRDTTTLSAMRSVSFLIASLGNPPPYHSTRHSIGHMVLQHLRSLMDLPSFVQKSRPYGGGHVSVGNDTGRPEFTLYQSAVQMNVSGPPLLKAWKHFAEIQDTSARTPALIVLHDEMEINPGRIKVRRGNGSAKGHNGIKSVQASLQGAGLLDHLSDRFVKIGIGIGRPTSGSRQSTDVSAYVLGQLTTKEKDGLEQAAEEVQTVLYQELARVGQM